MKKMIKNVVFDVDGVFTDGSFLYDITGKVYKRFGAHDSDGIKCLRVFGVNFFAISADKRGFNISKARMHDMGIELYLVSESDRYEFVKSKCNLNATAFVGDGAWDAQLLRDCCLGIAPANATNLAKKSADFVLQNRGGDGAVFEAIELIIKQNNGEREWNNFFNVD